VSDASSGEALLEDFFKLHPADLRKKVRVVTPEILGQNHLLHISKDANIKVFTPNVTRRAAHKEDRSVPRVCVAPSLVACMFGYSSILYEFSNDINTTYYSGDKNVKWNGGWVIYGLPYRVALFPNEQLVPLGPASDEHWLVTHDQQSTNYRPEQMGDFYVESVVQNHVKGQKQSVIELFVRVTHPDGLFLDQQHMLAQGCWHVRVKNFDSADGVAGRGTMDLAKIPEEQYQTRRRLSLSAESLRPVSSAW
jgi:hypothetical protein